MARKEADSTRPQPEDEGLEPDLNEPSEDDSMRGRADRADSDIRGTIDEDEEDVDDSDLELEEDEDR